MDRDLFSHVAHGSHDFCNPMGEETAAAILDQLDPKSAARERGLHPRWSRTASDEEWVAYEARYAENAVAFLHENPEHPDADAMRARIDSWQETVHRWGLSTLGFGFYLLETPANRP